MALTPNLQLGETNPTDSTLQYKASRLAGLTLVDAVLLSIPLAPRQGP